MHTGARARKQKYIISIYISLYMKTFLKTGVLLYIYIYIYIYIYWKQEKTTLLSVVSLTYRATEKSKHKLPIYIYIYILGFLAFPKQMGQILFLVAAKSTLSVLCNSYFRRQLLVGKRLCKKLKLKLVFRSSYKSLLLEKRFSS